MILVSTYWWLWLVVFIVSLGCALYSQLKNMNTILNDSSTTKSILSGAVPVVISAFIAFVSGILLLLGVAVRVIVYLKSQGF